MGETQLLEKEREIVEYASGKNILLENKAVELLKEAPDFREIVDALVKENHFIVDRSLVENKLRKSKIGLASDVVVRKTRFKAGAKDAESDLRVLKELDVTAQCSSEGTVENFLDYFQNKFKLLSGMLKRRHVLNPKPISAIKSVPKNSEVHLLGMVFKKWISKNGHLAIQIEDTETMCIALILKDNRRLMELGERVMPDDVVGVKASKISDDMVIVKEVLWPDLPVRQQKLATVDLCLAGLSDTHVGSKLFLEKPFSKFLDWINGRIGSPKERNKVGKIKYLVISGDNVDGIGIYPNQFNELNIKDINKQYEEFSRLVMEIPEYIEVVICPGQHDAVRWADPKPAIPQEFVKELSALKNVHLVGSPSWIEIEGLKVMVYHGDSLHDLIGKISFLDSSRPAEAMVELIKKRDLMSEYGSRHPYAPEKKDFMVIREEPDLVLFGDMHHNSYANYRGVTVINSGTWQGRTAYQIKLGHTPTPGIVPVYELATGKIKETHFCGEGKL